ncbi:MAG: YicC family protein [Phycisphaerae bacterium]|nr:YicC family protein [Phycisphaerae bacterium]
MISSMTGFGEATAEAEGIVYTVEIRAVNNRYFKPHVRLPDIAAYLEADIEMLHREKIHRGAVNFSLRMKNVSGRALFEIDENALAAYMDKLGSLAGSNHVNCRLDLASLLVLPGIVQPVSPDSEQSDKMKRVILQLTGQAIDRLKEMRAVEGKALAVDLIANCEVIENKLTEIRKRSGVVIEEYHEKLKRRVAQLLSDGKLKIDEETLAREMAVFADRCDISEELIRLGSHLEQFVKCCREADHAGRRLDFISQEMLREANTIGSKASDARISQWVIDIKCAVDRIKEQVQNVE